MKFTEDEKRDIRKKLTIIIFGVLFVYAVFNFDMVVKIFSNIATIVRPIIFGCIVAFVANMIMNQYEKIFNFLTKKNTKTTRLISMILAFLTLLSIIVFVFSVVVPEFINSVVSMLYQLPLLIQQSIINLRENAWFEEFAKNIEKFINSMQVGNLINRGIEIIRAQGASVFSGTLYFVGQIFSSFFEAFLAMSISVYIVSGKNRLARNSKKVLYSVLSENIADKLIKIIRLLYRNFYNFFVGQSLEAIFLGTMVFLGAYLLGSPYALMLGVTSGVLNFIPFFGALAGAIISTVLIMITNPTKGLIFLVYILIVQQLDGNYLYPHLVGSKMGIPSFWILIALSMGGALMGIIGMVISIPITATIYVLTREFTNKKLSEKNIDIDNK